MNTAKRCTKNSLTEKCCTSDSACEIHRCKGRHHRLLEGRFAPLNGVLYPIARRPQECAAERWPWGAMKTGSFLASSHPSGWLVVPCQSVGSTVGDFPISIFANPTSSGFGHLPTPGKLVMADERPLLVSLLLRV